MKKNVMRFLVLLAAFLIAGLASADTLDEGDANKVANLAVETVVPEQVTVTVVMTGGSFKIGDVTYKDQTTVELPYASDLAVSPVDAQLTKADLDFVNVTPAYHLEASVLKVSKIRTDGTVTLTFEKAPVQSSLPQTGVPQPIQEGLIALLPNTSDSQNVWLSFVGLTLVLSLATLTSYRRRTGQEK